MREDVLTIEAAKRILAAAREVDDASILEGSTLKHFEVQKLPPLELGTEKPEGRPYKIGFPFRSIYVIDATDTSATVNLKVNTDDSFQSAIPLKKNSGIKFPRAIASGSLYWDAQPGKTLTLLVFLTGEYDSGQLISVNSGGLNLNYGDAVAPQAFATVGVAAAQLFAADSSRKKMIIQNFSAVSVFVSGDATVTDSAGAKPGIEIPPGATFEWLSTSACYAIATAAATPIGLNKFS